MKKKLCSLLLAVLMLLTLLTAASCGAGKEDAPAGDSTQSIDESIDSSSGEEIHSPELDSDDITPLVAREKFEDLFKAGMKYTAEGRDDQLLGIIRADDPDSVLEELKAIFSQTNYNDYPAENAFYETIYQNDNVFYGFYYNSLTTAEGSKTNSVMEYQVIRYSYAEDGWKFDVTNDGVQKTKDVMESLLKDEKNALNNYTSGRNFAIFGGNDFSWVHAEAVVPGALVSNVYLVWQNEDGSISGMYVIKNGTDVIKRINSVKMSLTSDSLGEVFGFNDAEDFTINPGKCKKLYFTIPANEVKTGTESWGGVSYSLDIGS